MKAVGLSGTVGHVPGVPFMDTETAMRRVGLNCGNLVFQYAVAGLIDEPVNLVGSEIGWNPKVAHQTCRVLVVPSANFLREGADFTAFTTFLERVDLPLVFVGLGAQAESLDESRLDFHPSVLRLLDLIRERSEKVAVRGAFTARVLEHFGITHYEITGCPSNFINPAPDFAQMIADKLARPMRSFLTHADEPWPKRKIKAEVERRLVEWTRDGRGIMVQQAVPGVMRYLRQGNPFASDAVPDNFEKSLAGTLMPGADLEAFRDFMALKVRTYYAVDQWLEDSAHFDFSVGLRLHGNMAAWQAGTPALWITHDARTAELAETMALPALPIGDFLETCATVEDARARVEFDPAAYAARRADLYRRVSDVLGAAGVKVRAAA